jgi:hypothetical protein
MQPIAVAKFYSPLWSKAKVIELDIDSKNRLAVILDKGGTDKLIQFPNGTLAFLAQRFRSWDYRNKNDWTLRETELNKAIQALQIGGFIASFYAYGWVNKSETDFIRFKVFDYKRALVHILPRFSRGYYHLLPNVNGGPGLYAIPFNHIPEDYFVLDYAAEKQLIFNL